MLDAQSVVQEEQIGERMLAPERYWVELTDFKIEYPDDQFPEKYPIKADDIVPKFVNGALQDGIFVQTGKKAGTRWRITRTPSPPTKPMSRTMPVMETLQEA